MNFAGLKLDVITGHPEYELLFVATQVAQAVGFKNPAVTLGNFFKALDVDPVTYSQVHSGLTSPLTDSLGRKLSRNARFISETQAYVLILRSHAAQGEPFRKWVTEEVLPTIRKTGSYNVETSTTAEGIQFASEFRAVNDELKALRGQIEELKAIIQAQPKVTVSARRLGLYSRVCLKIHDKAQGSAPEETPYFSIGFN
ncbi:hypothetical protein CTV95_11355 [Pectobacterium brasiliense]|nr:hypothetical protein CTV95_11355 [Pectobacterium brasiliense]